MLAKLFVPTVTDRLPKMSRADVRYPDVLKRAIRERYRIANLLVMLTTLLQTEHVPQFTAVDAPIKARSVGRQLSSFSTSSISAKMSEHRLFMPAKRQVFWWQAILQARR
jgi:hypothetical protein